MSPSFKHALVAIDQSPASDIIIDCLPHLSRLGTEKLTLFISVSIPWPGGLSRSTEEKIRKKLDDYKKILEESLSGTGLPMLVDTLAGFEINAYPPQGIIKTAHEQKADYIIVANRGYSKYRELLMGSTATELLQRSDLPVYLLNLSVSESEEMSQESEFSSRHLYCVRSCRDALQHILYPTDFSNTADRAFDALENLVSGQSVDTVGRITLYHVQATGRIGMDDPEKLAEFNFIDRQRLEVLKKRLQKRIKAEITIDIGTGSAAFEIIEKANSAEATMIIMGGQGRSYIHELFLGGVSHQVVRKSIIPVLIIPALQKDGPKDKTGL